MREKTKGRFWKISRPGDGSSLGLYTNHLTPEAVICFGCVAANERRAICNILVLAGGYEESSLGDMVTLFPRHFIKNFECGIR